MRCSALQCVAVRCNVLQSIAVWVQLVHCNAINRACGTRWLFIVLQCTAACYNVLHCVAASAKHAGTDGYSVCCRLLQCVAVCPSVFSVSKPKNQTRDAICEMSDTWHRIHNIGYMAMYPHSSTQRSSTQHHTRAIILCVCVCACMSECLSVCVCLCACAYVSL